MMVRLAIDPAFLWLGTGFILNHLYIEPDRQEILQIECMRGGGSNDEIIILFYAHTIVFFLPLLAFRHQVINFRTTFAQEALDDRSPATEDIFPAPSTAGTD